MMIYDFVMPHIHRYSSHVVIDTYLHIRFRRITMSGYHKMSGNLAQIIDKTPKKNEFSREMIPYCNARVLSS